MWQQNNQQRHSLNGKILREIQQHKIVCLCTRRTDSKNHDITIAQNEGILVMYSDALVERSVFYVVHFGFMHLFNFSCVNLRSRYDEGKLIRTVNKVMLIANTVIKNALCSLFVAFF